MLEAHASECKMLYLQNEFRMLGPRLGRRIHDLRKISKRYFGFAIDIDEIAKLLQRAENKERIDIKREILPHRDLLAEDEVEHEKGKRGTQEVNDRALNKTQ